MVCLTEAQWLGGRRQRRTAPLPTRAAAVALAAVASAATPSSTTTRRFPRSSRRCSASTALRVFSNNLSRGYSEARILRPVSRVRHGFRLPADGGVRHQLLFQALGWRAQAHHDRRDVDFRGTYRAAAGGIFRPHDGASSDKEYFFSWQPARRFTSGKIKLDDYDFKKSGPDLSAHRRRQPAFRSRDARGVRLSRPLRRKRRRSEDRRRHGATWNASNDHHFNAEGECVSCFPGALRDPRGQERERPRRRISGAALQSTSFTDQAYRSGAADAGEPRL